MADSQGAAGSDAIGFGSLPRPGLQQVEPGPILESVRELGERLLGPRAEATDRRNSPDPELFAALGAAGLLGLAAPVQYGGLDAPGSLQREYTELLASYCGVTAFTQAQHHGPCRMIASCPNEALKKRLLPDLAAGRTLCGVSFAHLRRPGPPTLNAKPVSGGFRLQGTAPWVTGWGFFQQFVFGAALADGRFVYLWSPARPEDYPDLFPERDPRSSGSLTASEPMPLCAMNASATVSVRLDDWFVPAEHWLSESDREMMRRNDCAGVLGGTAMPLGCTAASVRLLKSTAERRSLPAVARAAGAFERELQNARGSVEEWGSKSNDENFYDHALPIRAWCIELAVRAAHAAVAASSGSANSLSHPAQRLYREAMFYTVQAQTHDVMAATLARLEGPPSREA